MSTFKQGEGVYLLSWKVIAWSTNAGTVKKLKLP